VNGEELGRSRWRRAVRGGCVKAEYACVEVLFDSTVQSGSGVDERREDLLLTRSRQIIRLSTTENSPTAFNK
jgi:hypothetical protein